MALNVFRWEGNRLYHGRDVVARIDGKAVWIRRSNFDANGWNRPLVMPEIELRQWTESRASEIIAANEYRGSVAYAADRMKAQFEARHGA
jgi:hypothetical protein